MYLISKEGKCGRKSFPTKKHIKTQSSTLLSKLKGKGKLAMVNSRSRYCRKTTTFNDQVSVEREQYVKLELRTPLGKITRIIKNYYSLKRFAHAE